MTLNASNSVLDGLGKGEDGMNSKCVGMVALVLPLLAWGTAQAQHASQSESDKNPTLLLDDITKSSVGTVSAMEGASTGLSSWITYNNRPNCCGPMGGDGPIESEVYFRSGASLPIEGPYFGHVLETGWIVQGGARVLFFDPPQTAAWALDISVSNIYNHGQHNDIHVPLHNIIVPSPTPPILGGATTISVPTVNVSTQSLNRTFFNAGLGREWYLWGAANEEETNWRIGIDAGGRYGSAKLDLNELKHRTSSIGGAYLSLHTDLEIPYGKCLLMTGFRVEWDYTWMRILQQQNDANLQDLNLLLTAGVRF